MDVLAQKAVDTELIEYLPLIIGVTAGVSVAFVAVIEGVLLPVSIRKIVSCCHCREKGRMDKEVVFYMLPAVAGVLVAAIMRLLMITVTDGVPVLLYDRYPILYLVIPMIAVSLGASASAGFIIKIY